MRFVTALCVLFFPTHVLVWIESQLCITWHGKGRTIGVFCSVSDCRLLGLQNVRVTGVKAVGEGIANWAWVVVGRFCVKQRENVFI